MKQRRFPPFQWTALTVALDGGIFPQPADFLKQVSHDFGRFTSLPAYTPRIRIGLLSLENV